MAVVWGRQCQWILGFCALLGMTPLGTATTHWIVTEDGKIQQQVDSPMNLKHPHDLVMVMRQETTVNYLKQLEKQLVAQKIHIEENEDRDTGLEPRHYKDDPDCIKAKVPLGDLDLYHGTYISLESKDIGPEDYVDTQTPLPIFLGKPDCTKIVALPYSIHAFQHLRGIQERVNLSAPDLPKEDPLFHALSRRLGENIDDIGHRIKEGLLKNSSSWVLYDMASFYWMIKNEPYHVLECAMRALHFSSRHFKDIALINMANILHRAHFSADAAILGHAALDVSSDFLTSLTSHYTLGNIYAMLGEYNHSVLCYDHALQAKPDFEHAVMRKHAVLCQQKLEQKLEAQHRSLQRTLNELKEYQKQHDHYLRQQDLLEKHKLIQEEQILKNIIHETQMAKEAQLGNHQMCRLGQQKMSLHCQWDLPARYHRSDMFENVALVQFDEDMSVAKMTSENLKISSNQSNLPLQSPPIARSVFRVWGQESSTFKDEQEKLWPKRTDCAKSFPSIPSTEDLPTYFLPPENRGLGLPSSMSKPVVSFGEPHAPDCSSISDVRANGSIHQLMQELQGRLEIKAKIPDYNAKQILFSRVINLTVTEEQIGELLFQSLEKPSDPLWFVLNEAGLYWRAVGNGTSAIACLRRAYSMASREYQDIPLVNLANLLNHYGLHQEASQFLLKSLSINDSEPLTFMSLGNANLAQRNISGALQVFRRALDLTTRCPLCNGSLKLIRCMQFYPFLYNNMSSTCSGHCLQNSQEVPQYSVKHEKMMLVRASREEVIDRGAEHSEDDALMPSPLETTSVTLENVVILEGNNSEKQPSPGETRMSEEMLALVDEFQNSWPLDAFEGALEVKGRRLDLQGIRVLKKGSQDGLSGSCFGDCEDDDEAEWITFQVKRLKKPKTDSLESQDTAGKRKKETVHAFGEDHSRSALEISGPKIPSPGPHEKKPDYRSLGWPSPEECAKLRRVELSTVASTWLAVSAKNIDITEHIDFGTQLQEPSVEPLCNANHAASMHTLDHLLGVAGRASIHYTGESQLKEVLQNLGKDKYPPQSFEQVGTRIAKVLEKNQTSWVLSSMAALYWRVKGQGKKAIDCLRQALHYAPHSMKEEFEKAMQWYESTLKLQPEFAPAKDRIRTIQCHLLLKRERRYP
ncbi:tetratricopeptide repeat protein 17 isoform X2 [Ambystoma mexicanum]|uniref:tetratricopeptide repeat protein 17 isoform X2 n=1 Tax=Ambystoma mexicanum TaxID=8296 RepID=UPI0037E8430F